MMNQHLFLLCIPLAMALWPQTVVAGSIYLYFIANKSNQTVYLSHQNNIELEPNEDYRLKVHDQKLEYLKVETQDELITFNIGCPLEDGCRIALYNDEEGGLALDVLPSEGDSE